MKTLTHKRLRYFSKNKPRFILLFILVISFITHSCYKDRLDLDKIAGGKWTPEVAGPIAHADLSMSYLIKDSKNIWKEYPDGLLSLIYRQNAITDIAADIISVPDQQNDTTFNFSLSPAMQVGDSTFEYLVFDTQFTGHNGERLDSILIKNGLMEFEVTTDLNHDGYLEITIPSLTKYGVTFRKRIDFTYSGNSSTTVKVTASLEDYYLTLINTGGLHNYLKEYIKVSATKLATPDLSPYSFELKQSTKGLNYYLAMGYFHQHTINIDETSIPINLFDNQTVSSIFIEDPHLIIKFHNSYGLPTDITMDEFYAEKDGVKKNITSSLLPTISINYPSFAQIGQSDTTTLHFNINNSNIKDIIAMNPKKIVFKGFAQTNPSGTPTDNFILDTSKIMVDAELEIPMYGRALEFELRDTTAINTGDTPDYPNEIKSITINLNSDNGFPIDVKLQLYMIDSLDNIIDSVFKSEGHLVAAAPIGPAPDYRVTSKQHNLARISLDQSQIDSYNKAEGLILSARASTTDAGTKVVKLYSDYSVYMEVSAKVELETNF